MKKLTENLVQQRLKTCTTDLDKVQQINVTGRELKDVSLLRKMTGVEILSLSVNQISSLVDFQCCKNLKELYLRNNKITDLNEIFYLKSLPKLELLVLSQNPCSESPGYRMTAIKNLKNLTELDGVPITSEERRQAQKAGIEIILSDDPIDPSDNCIPDDTQTKRIHTQTIQGTKATQENVAEIIDMKQTSQTKEEKEPQIPLSTNENTERIPQMPSRLEGNRRKTNPIFNAEGATLNGHPSNKSYKILNFESMQSTRIIPKNANILSATISLIKELDYSALQVINAEVCSRLNAFEIEFLCQGQTFPLGKGGTSEGTNV